MFSVCVTMGRRDRNCKCVTQLNCHEVRVWKKQREDTTGNSSYIKASKQMLPFYGINSADSATNKS